MDQNFCGPNFFSDQNFFSNTKFLFKHKILLGPKKFLGPKIFFTLKIVIQKFFFRPKVFSNPKFLTWRLSLKTGEKVFSRWPLKNQVLFRLKVEFDTEDQVLLDILCFGCSKCAQIQGKFLEPHLGSSSPIAVCRDYFTDFLLFFRCSGSLYVW